MWIVGNWGQASPWTRDTGVIMVKGEDDVWTGELSLPKGTKFDVKILKSTVSTTSGGDNTWSAVRYASTLNISASHDFGEFTDNLIPNGNFDEGQVKWTPVKCIQPNSDFPNRRPNILLVGAYSPAQCTSDAFVIPPNQTLRFTGYMRGFRGSVRGGVTLKIVTPQQQTLFEFSVSSSTVPGWYQFSKTFRSADVPMECQIVLSNEKTDSDDWKDVAYFDSLSLVSP